MSTSVPICPGHAAPDPRQDLEEEEAHRIVAGEPVTSGWQMRADLRPYRLGLLRGRDNGPVAPGHQA